MFNEIIANTSKIIISNADKIKLTLAAIFSEGSILIEDYPGSGKTTFAKAITQNLGLNFKGYSLHLIYYPVIFLDLIFFQMGS